ncbi:MAG: response regulator transcription factor [Planctomycetota bacterium]|nr:MAG: response regulator transcription factor [Planctomycetota bacterium]
MNDTVRIVLADDHQVVRQGLRALLQSQPGFTVVGEASDGLRAVEVVEQLRPDVLVADLMMPGLSGLDVALRVAKRAPRTRTVVLSMYADEAYVVQALRNGALAYVPKDAGAPVLIQAIKEAAAGRIFLGPPFSSQTVEAWLKKAESIPQDSYESLTPRERQVLHMAAEGLTNAQIAENLRISPRTAETHRANLLHKLGLKGQTELVRYALARGIVRLDPTRAEGAESKGA